MACPLPTRYHTHNPSSPPHVVVGYLGGNSTPQRYAPVNSALQSQSGPWSVPSNGDEGKHHNPNKDCCTSTPVSLQPNTRPLEKHRNRSSSDCYGQSQSHTARTPLNPRQLHPSLPQSPGATAQTGQSVWPPAVQPPSPRRCVPQTWTCVPGLTAGAAGSDPWPAYHR